MTALAGSILGMPDAFYTDLRLNLPSIEANSKRLSAAHATQHNIWPPLLAHACSCSP